ncbi:MAG: hypothetical protein WDW36_001090 [Sanguina aurantia]
MQAPSSAMDSPSRMAFPAEFKFMGPRDGSCGQYSDSLYGSSTSTLAYGSSPDNPFFNPSSMLGQSGLKLPSQGAAQIKHLAPCVHPGSAVAASAAVASCPPASPASTCVDLLHCSLPTLLGTCEMLGHGMEDRTSICRQQDAQLLSRLQVETKCQLRDGSQRPLFVVAPLDVLVTRDNAGRNQFHIIEINGTGISGLTNMSQESVRAVLASFAEAPLSLLQENCLVLVASSGQETFPPVSRTLHEKMLYIEALRRGFEATGRECHITNMTRLEKRPDSMPRTGVTLVLGYMKQFRAQFMLDATTHNVMLFGRPVHAAINDRFVLNIMHQFNHQVDLTTFTSLNAGFAAGADKGIAYELYNQFFGSEEHGAHFGVMAPSMDFQKAQTREQLLEIITARLDNGQGPVVIKPQGTGCGHGIEFFFAPQTQEEIVEKVDRAMQTVGSNYNMQCGGLPFTVCGFLDTAAINSEVGETHKMNGHKFELRIVVYRCGSELLAFPSIAKVAREAFDPEHPSNKKSLINNITTSAKETATAGAEFMLPLANTHTLGLLGISLEELTELCTAATHFIAYTIDQVQDNPEVFGLPA